MRGTENLSNPLLEPRRMTGSKQHVLTLVTLLYKNSSLENEASPTWDIICHNHYKINLLQHSNGDGIRICCIRRLTNLSSLTTWWDHANAVDAIMIETLICSIEKITQVCTTSSASNFSFSTQAQIDCGIAVRGSWRGSAPVAHVGQPIRSRQWWGMKAGPRPLRSWLLVELLMWHPQRSTTTCTPENALGVLVIWPGITRHATAILHFRKLTTELREMNQASSFEFKVGHVLDRTTLRSSWPGWTNAAFSQSLPRWDVSLSMSNRS